MFYLINFSLIFQKIFKKIEKQWKKRTLFLFFKRVPIEKSYFKNRSFLLKEKCTKKNIPKADF